MAVAPLGVQLAHRLPNAPLTIAFSLVLAWVALRSWCQPSVTPASAGSAPPKAPAGNRLCEINPASGRLNLISPCVLALAGTGALGLLSGLLGVGGGFVIVPMMASISDVPMKGIVATSLAVIALVSVGGVAGSVSTGGVDWHVAIPFAAGAMIALLGGRQLARRLAGPYLHKAFGVTAGVVAVLLLLRGIGWVGI